MVRAMVGGVAPEEQAEMPVRVTVQASGNDKGLTVDHLSAESQRGALRDVTLHIAPGEQVGVTGLLSAGVVTLGRAVAGVEPWTSGRVLIDGKPLTPGRRDLALKAGAGYVLFQPSSLLNYSDIFLFGAGGLDYFTHLRHFSVGLEVDVSYLVTSSSLGFAVLPNVRYAF